MTQGMRPAMVRRVRSVVECILGTVLCSGGMPDLRVLASFVAVVQEGSVSGGARRVGITQPAMSRQMRSLEDELGVALLVRGAGALRTTPDGARFYDRVSDLLAQAEQVIGRTKQEAEQRRTSLHVVAPSATIDSAIVPFLAADGDGLPVLDCEVADPFRVFDDARARGADLGVSTRPPAPGWVHRRFADGVVRAHMPAAHPLAGRAGVELDDLLAEHLVLLTPNSAARRVLDEAVHARGATYGEHVVVRHPSIARVLVRTGHGVAALTDDPFPSCVALPIVVDREPLTFPLFAGWDPANPNAEIIEDVVARFGRHMRRTTRRRLQRVARALED